MKTFPRLVRLALLVMGLALGGCATTRIPPPPISLAEVPQAQLERAKQNVQVFNKVWTTVAKEYYDVNLHGLDWPAVGAKFGPEVAKATDDRTLYDSLNRMLDLLNDSHTGVMSPAEAKEMNKGRGLRSGFGWRSLEGRAVVGEVFPGSPAEQAGIKRGWIYVARNGAPITADMEVLGGEATVGLDFLDEADRPVHVTLVRKMIATEYPPVVKELEGGFVYLRFDEFTLKNMRWLSSELKSHGKAPGVVVDLRRNPGGRAMSLSFVIGEFFDHAVNIGTSISRDGDRDAEKSWQFRSARYAGKVVLLVDEPTASCAEILSAVLRETGRATVVGRKTSGAVMGAFLYSLPDGGELEVSVDDYLTTKGTRLEGVGVTPDIVVKATYETIAELRAGRDRDMEAAIAVLKGEKKIEVVAAEAGEEAKVR